MDCECLSGTYTEEKLYYRICKKRDALFASRCFKLFIQMFFLHQPRGIYLKWKAYLVCFRKPFSPPLR